ncbi:hypothetical protein [Pseudaestuariivita sp.]|uniref:hypothetical protein n=1 Tax=Pseudaestuariivita sp. TaxID=2211669 RepID=UPI004058EBB6
MRRLFLTIALLALGSAAQAACYVEYKAKRDAPLQLHYGVLELGDAACQSADRARARATARLETAGWSLLTVLSAQRQTPTDQMRDNAGPHYLRY